HSASVILCHGLGDTGNGWVDPAMYLASKLPHVKFILPTAPTQPVTLNMGMPMPSWYDIIGLDSRSNEVCNGLDESMDKILELVENEVGECNGVGAVDYSRIVLAGFSQGGALALYTDVQQKGLGLAGIVIMSGYLPRSSSFTIASGSETTPILHCHGTEDSVVAVEAAGLSKDRVSSLMEDKGGKKELYQVKTYRGLDHSVLMEELDDVSAFLNKVIP
ncbi:phospholipase, partial [Thalassiosira pseudonana CCMP1335]